MATSKYDFRFQYLSIYSSHYNSIGQGHGIILNMAEVAWLDLWNVVFFINRQPGVHAIREAV